MAVLAFRLGLAKTWAGQELRATCGGDGCIQRILCTGICDNDSWDWVVPGMMPEFRFALCGLLFLAGMLWGQVGSSAPQQGSGAPKPDARAEDPAKAPSELSAKDQTNPAQSRQPASVQSEESGKADAGEPGASSHTDPSAGQGSVPTLPVAAERVPAEPKQPKTEILDTSATAGALATDGHDPILDPPPFPKGTTTLVGGVISGIDPIRNHLTVGVFGGGHWTIFYDERTHIFRNGAEVTSHSLKKGERVFVDTMLDNNGRDIFARNIRVGVAQPPALIDGQIIDFDLSHSLVTLRDSINTVPVHFSVDHDTKISDGMTLATIQELAPGSLVKVKFAPARPNRGLAREITII